MRVLFASYEARKERYVKAWSAADSKPRDVLVQLNVTGGRVPIWDELSRVPLFTLYGDGTVIVARKRESDFGWDMLTAQLGEPAVNTLLSGILIDNRFFETTSEHQQWPAPIDLPTTHILVQHAGQKRTISIEGLIGWRRDESENWVSDAVRSELDRLSDIAHRLSTFTTTGLKPYRARRLILFVMIGHPDSSDRLMEKSIARWPFREIPLEEVPLDPLTNIGRRVLTGNIVEKVVHATRVRNYFRSKKTVYLVSSRVLLPYERSNLEHDS